MKNKLLSLLVLLALMSQFSPANLLPVEKAQAQGPAAVYKLTGIQPQVTANVSKISGLLVLQVQAKRQAAKAGILSSASVASNQSGLFQSLQSTGMKVEDLSKQQIFIHFTQKPTQSQLDELQADGITPYPDSWIPPVGNNPNGFILADMPVDRLDTLALKVYVSHLETAEQVFQPQNDLAAQKINAPAVWSSGYNGTGVRIAVLDSGLDLTNPDIPTPVIKKDYWSYPLLDDTIANIPGITGATGHGTHVTGSVMGSGNASGGVYKGIAPGVSLIFLKIGGDTTTDATSAAIVGAIRAATDNYSANVITMSYGGWSDYHDGSDEMCQAVDYAVSKGVTVLIAAGNDASRRMHYSGTVNANSATDFIPITVSGSQGYPIMLNNVWYDGLGTSNILSIQYYTAQNTNNPYTTVNGPQSESPRGTESSISSMGGNPSGTYYLKVNNSSNNTQFFHLYVWSGSATFASADLNYTMGSPAEADGAIAVGAYTTRKVWYDYANNGRQLSSETVDQIATFSSCGPRVDTGAPGKPNIVAPGAQIISARDNVVYLWANRNSSYVDNNGPNRSNANGGSNDANGPADYYVMSGTSMATPIAAGAAALIIQKNPGITPAQVRNALQATAVDKGAPGWDGTYGYGLINAQAAVLYPLSVTTYPADNITGLSARLVGNLDSLGSMTSANVSFQWGLISGNYTFDTNPVSMNATGIFSANLTGLTSNTTYYLRAKAVGDAIAYGNEVNFTAQKALISMLVTPGNTVLLPGVTSQFGATGTYSDNSTANLTGTVAWTSSNNSVTTIDPSGLATGLVAGNTTITATLNGISGNVSLQVLALVEVNSGQSIFLSSNATIGNIPITIKGIPGNGNSSGISSIILNLNWNKDVIHVDNITVPSIAGFSVAPGIPNNTTGTANFTGNTSCSYLSGNVTLANLGIRAVGNVGDNASINVTVTRLVDQNQEPSINTFAISAPVVIQPLPDIGISVVLQGGTGRPDAGWVVPLTVKFFPQNTVDVLNDTAGYTFTQTTTKSGSTAVTQVTGIIPGTYDITVKSAHTLVNVKRSVVISQGVTVNMGTLLDGNAREDGLSANIISGADFSFMSNYWGKLVGDALYSAQADFNLDGVIGGADFSVLSNNWNKESPNTVQ